MSDDRIKYLAAGIISAAASLVMFYLILRSVPGSFFYFLNLEEFGPYGNVISYLFIGCFFSLLFLFLSLLVKHDRFPVPKIKFNVRYGIILVSVVMIVALYLFQELLNYAGALTHKEIMAITIIIALISIVVLYYEAGKFDTKWIVFIVYFIIAIIVGISVTTPNTFGGSLYSSSYNLHHSSAVIDSIYNILHDIPYSGNITDQYGHYSLFFYIPLKLFGENTLVISIIFGILYATAFLFLMGAVHIMVRSNYLRVLIAIAGGLCIATAIAHDIYWQTHPIRILFPSLMIFFIALSANKRLTKKEYIIGSVISVVSVLWNFESGMATSVAWFIFIFINYYQHNDFTIKNFIERISTVSLFLALYIFLPYLIVNLYNLLVTGLDLNSLLSIRSFFGPITNSDYIDELKTTLEWGNFPYLYFMFIFLGCIAWSLRSTSIISKEGKPSEFPPVIAATSVVGLALLTQTMNRTIAAPTGVWLFVAIVLGLMAYGIIEVIKDIKGWRRFGAYDLSKITICSLALIGLILMGLSAVDLEQNLKKKYDGGCYDYNDFVSFANEISANIPEDTMGVGEGTAAIYMELGWDKKWYIFNASTLYEECFSTNDAFLTNMKYSNYVDMDHYSLEKRFSYKETSYGYYVRI